MPMIRVRVGAGVAATALACDIHQTYTKDGSTGTVQVGCTGRYNVREGLKAGEGHSEGETKVKSKGQC